MSEEGKRFYEKYEYVDFDIVNEDWNLYELEDHSLLKIKFVLINVIREKVARSGPTAIGLGYGLQSTNVVGVIPSPEVIGKPSTPEKKPEVPILEELKFKAIKEDWNEYKLKDGTVISAKNVLVKVAPPRQYDSQGIPIYGISTDTVIKGSAPKEVRERLLKQIAKSQG